MLRKRKSCTRKGCFRIRRRTRHRIRPGKPKQPQGKRRESVIKTIILSKKIGSTEMSTEFISIDFVEISVVFQKIQIQHTYCTISHCKCLLWLPETEMEIVCWSREMVLVKQLESVFESDATTLYIGPDNYPKIKKLRNRYWPSAKDGIDDQRTIYPIDVLLFGHWLHAECRYTFRCVDSGVVPPRDILLWASSSVVACRLKFRPSMLSQKPETFTLNVSGIIGDRRLLRLIISRYVHHDRRVHVRDYPLWNNTFLCFRPGTFFQATNPRTRVVTPFRL